MEDDRLLLCRCKRNRNCPEICAVSGGFLLVDHDLPGEPEIELSREQAVDMSAWILERMIGEMPVEQVREFSARLARSIDQAVSAGVS